MDAGDKLALGAVAALAALGLVRRRGGRNHPGGDIYPGHNISLREKKGKLPGVDRSHPVQVYFNLAAMQYGHYPKVRTAPDTMRPKFEAHALSIEAGNQKLKEKGRCQKTNPGRNHPEKLDAIINEYNTGPIYSIKQNNKVVALARALVLQNVVFTVSGSNLKSIRQKSKTPCCYGDGYLLDTGSVSYDHLDLLTESYENEGVKPVPVAIIPDSFSTFVTFPSGEPVFTADYAVFAGNPSPKPGRKPAMIMAFGVNKDAHRDWYKRGQTLRTSSCVSDPIQGVSINNRKRPAPAWSESSK
jgi:hypothetical protein